MYASYQTIHWNIMLKSFLTAVTVALLLTPSYAQILTDEQLLMQQTNTNLPTVNNRERRVRTQRPSPSGSVIGPIRDPKTRIRGALINNQGDSARGLWRINRKRSAYVRAEAAAWPNADEVAGTFRRDEYWFSENNFWESEE